MLVLSSVKIWWGKCFFTALTYPFGNVNLLGDPKGKLKWKQF